MQEKRKRRIPVFVKLLIFLVLPALLITGAFYWVGTYYREEDKIYPNISIAGTDVSWMTHSQAVEALNLSDFEEKVNKTSVTIIFPDASEVTITGEDIGLTNDAMSIVDTAFSIGRGQGFFKDTISFIKRLYSEELYLDIHKIYNNDIIHVKIIRFTEEYNNRLATTKPVVFSDRILITKGAGQEPAEAIVLKDLAYIGLFESFETGEPVEIIYILPETKPDVDTIVDLHHGIHVPTISAELDLETLTVSESTVGVHFDMMYAVELLNATETGKTITVPIEYTMPDTTQEYLESLLFRDLFGEQTTWVHGSSDRVTNIKISSEAINDLVLLPGDEFSFNDVVGVRNRPKGYRPAGAFIGGETATVIGGGICQTASTLHAAIVDTELLITERHPHSQRVPYLPRGRDATVYWGRLDFRFVNNTEFPIKIEFELDNRNLTARVYGTIIDNFPTPSQPIPAG